MSASPGGVFDPVNEVPALSFYQFLGVSSSGTMKGYFINRRGERTGASFSGTVPSGNGTTNPGSFTSISGAAIPNDAVGFKGQVGIDIYVDISNAPITNNPEFKANCANYPKITAGAEVAIGRVAGAETTTASFNVSNTLANSSIAINDGTTNTQKLAVSSGGAAKVEGGGTAGSAAAAVVTVQGIASMTPLLATAAGDTAAAATDAGNPVKIGAKAINVEVAAVTNAQRANFVSDLAGRQITMPFTNPESIVKGTTTSITDTTSTQIIAAQAASVKIYLTDVSVSNMHATVATRVDILDGATVIWQGPAAANGGGYEKTFAVPIPCTAATALNAKCGTTGATVMVSAVGYLSKL